MKRLRSWVNASFALGVFFIANQASAEPKRRAQEQTRDQNVAFDDDLLNADLGGASSGPVIGHPRRGHGPMLIRARTSFVPELCQSVENI